jgi:hypothetical protein
MKLDKIQKKVDAISPSWVGVKSVPAIIRSLNKTFQKSIIYFTSSRYDEAHLPNHSVIVSGQYCPRIFSTIPENILITLSFPVANKKVVITEKEAKNLAIKVVRAIHHEYRHKHQQRGRGYSYTKQYTPKQKKDRMKLMYYGNPDEIDAHAYETQAEHLNINNLRKAHKINWTECESIYMYRLHFRKADPKIWKRFLKKVYKLNVEVQAIPKRTGNKKSH